jgi:hypothetical protein
MSVFTCGYEQRAVTRTPVFYEVKKDKVIRYGLKLILKLYLPQLNTMPPHIWYGIINPCSPENKMGYHLQYEETN